MDNLSVGAVPVVGGWSVDRDEGGVVTEASAGVGEEITPDVVQERLGVALGPLCRALRERIEVTGPVTGLDDAVGVQDEGVSDLEGEHVKDVGRSRQAEPSGGAGCRVGTVTE